MAEAATEEITEATRNMRSFRSSPELEAFYRFVNDNGLRREAQMAFEFISNRMNLGKKKKKRSKSKKKLQ